MRFEWDKAKEKENITRHGVDFTTAQEAFRDPRRILLIDASHSQTEARLLCLGRGAGGILTVRLTFRGETARIIGAGYWRKGRKIYEQKNQIH